MPAKRGRTITSWGQMFPTISGAQIIIPPEPPTPPPSTQTYGGSGVSPRDSGFRSIITPRERRRLMRTIFMQEAEQLDTKELNELLEILDLADLDDLDLL